MYGYGANSCRKTVCQGHLKIHNRMLFNGHYFNLHYDSMAALIVLFLKTIQISFTVNFLFLNQEKSDRG